MSWYKYLSKSELLQMSMLGQESLPDFAAMVLPHGEKAVEDAFLLVRHNEVPHRQAHPFGVVSRASTLPKFPMGAEKVTSQTPSSGSLMYTQLHK